MELQYSTRDLARAAVIAAAYAALAWISNFFGLAFPAIQFLSLIHISEPTRP